MALFKVYRGDSTALPGGKDGWTDASGNRLAQHKMVDGYAYFCTDTGEFFIDVDFKGSVGLVRKQITSLSAEKLHKKDSSGDITLEIDNIVQTSDIIDVEHGGTGVTSLAVGGVVIGGPNETDGTPGPVQTISGKGVLYAATAGAPNFVDILPLTAGGTGGNDAESARDNLEVYSKNDVDKNATTKAWEYTLTVAGWTADPAGGYVQEYSNALLQCGAAHNVPPEITFKTNRDEYNKIESAMAESGVGIKFYIKEVPAKDIDIIIIDQL